MRVFDLSHTIVTGLPIFPGDPEVRLELANATPPWRVTRMTLGSHSGTHIDAPSHFFADGRSITDYPAARFILPAILVQLPDLADDAAIPFPLLRECVPGSPTGQAVLLATGWDRYWGTDRYFRHPYLSEEAATWLAEARAALVGIDALNVDSTVQGTDHAHAHLLGADVLIVENLRGLRTVPPGRDYLFVCLPLPLEGADGAPVRAVLLER
ncbi:cyclase family protein [Thermomicrobium sp. 4228-Ro]|uniref:cyclase family protein n=1 Tax=Thermomicrobium sp. 4228-Ro TaxID=2993937 RepID=UPI002249325A|nr:cyclase family protein [Thermomicrobium sp. 4228-Ro]MCX2727408.1 cyclase family protein [Thermomicrobium sp. 4228-Ro]